MLYDPNLYIFAYKLLNHKSGKVIVTNKEISSIAGTFECSILYPNNLNVDIMEVIRLIKKGNYKFTNLKGGAIKFNINNISKDILLIKAIVILLETTYGFSYFHLSSNFLPFLYKPLEEVKIRGFTPLDRQLKLKLKDAK
jgi:hypothetical protein